MPGKIGPTAAGSIYPALREGDAAVVVRFRDPGWKP
jgi:hypothetical protein